MTTVTSKRTAKKQWVHKKLLAKQQLWTCITLFCTFLCRHYMTTTWKCLISHFVENVNTRQWICFSFLELWYGLLQLQKKIVNIWWTERDGISPIKSEAWNTSFKWHFQSRSPSCRCCLSSLLLSLKLTMHSIVRESLTELISQNVPDSTGIASVMKYILKPQRNFSYLKFLLWK